MAIEATCDFFELPLASQPGQIDPRDAELGGITEFVGFGFGHGDASTPVYLAPTTDVLGITQVSLTRNLEPFLPL